MHLAPDARGGVELSIDGRQGRLLSPGEGVRVGSVPIGWEVPCIARPVRKRRGSPILASVSEDYLREAVAAKEARVEEEEEGEEPAGGWVEDLNGLLGFNKGFRGRFTGSDHEEE